MTFTDKIPSNEPALGILITLHSTPISNNVIGSHSFINFGLGEQLGIGVLVGVCVGVFVGVEVNVGVIVGVIVGVKVGVGVGEGQT